MSSLPASQSKPPVPNGSLKAASTFDSAASMPASQKQLPHPLKGAPIHNTLNTLGVSSLPKSHSVTMDFPSATKVVAVSML